MNLRPELHVSPTRIDGTSSPKRTARRRITERRLAHDDPSKRSIWRHESQSLKRVSRHDVGRHRRDIYRRCTGNEARRLSKICTDVMKIPKAYNIQQETFENGGRAKMASDEFMLRESWGKTCCPGYRRRVIADLRKVSKGCCGFPDGRK